MKVIGLCLFLSLCGVFVESGIILDTFKSGVDNTRQAVKCGAHRFGGLLTQGKIVKCEEKKPDEATNEIVANSKDEVTKAPDAPTKTPDVVSGKPTEKQDSANDEKGTTEKSATEIVTVSGGRRVIAVGANCPEGYRGDGKGNCREEY